ncbi:hypothetical protein [Brachybacterium fresconis]|uniref:Uncharacterized protein n=1 Tax=Brachybacterium fresconis TaxID=173363 RepID=A0ABS4YHJ6_9MICO|nr:hypothetical protein [Brachybacterium fresconis]MBP2408266.1 hypothetical protein [Brachybacterium fresconis]
MRTINWRAHMQAIFSSRAGLRVGPSDQPGSFGILGPDISVTRPRAGDYTGVLSYPRTADDHRRLGDLLHRIADDIDN